MVPSFDAVEKDYADDDFNTAFLSVYGKRNVPEENGRLLLDVGNVDIINNADLK